MADDLLNPTSLVGPKDNAGNHAGRVIVSDNTPMNAVSDIGEPGGGTLAFIVTTTQSVPFTATKLRLVADQDVAFEIGSNPMAVLATSNYLPAGTIEIRECSPGDRVAAISDGTDGNLRIRPVLPVAQP